MDPKPIRCSCGAVPKIERYFHGWHKLHFYYVRCPVCGKESKEMTSEFLAILDWNGTEVHAVGIVL